jgi:hypothetical protein
MTDERIIAYFLEELTEEETAQFEEELFAAQEWPPEVRAVEDQLIEDYIREQLSADRRQRFQEKYLWSTARRDRVATEAAFLQRIDDLAPKPDPEPMPVPIRPWWDFWGGWSNPLRLAAAAALVVVIAGAVWLAVLRPRSPQTLVTANLTLVNRTRGSEPPPTQVKLAARDALELRIELPPDAPAGANYEAELEDRDGQQYPLGPVRRDGPRVIVTVPSGKLRRGSYVLSLYLVRNGGRENVADTAYFNVE